MKLVDVAEYYSDRGGGVKTYIDQKLRMGAVLGHQVAIIAPGRETRVEQRFGGEVHWIAAPVLPFDDRYHQFWTDAPIHRALDALAPDVVEGSSTWRGSWAAARWRGSALKSWFIHQDPVAGYLHTVLDRRVSRPTLDRGAGFFWSYLRRLSSAFDTSVVGAPWLADRFEGFGLRRPHAISVGIDRAAFSPTLRTAAVKAELAALCGVRDPAAPLLLTVSRHHPEKRLETLIAAFGRASASQPMGLVIFGDGPSRTQVERLAAKTPHVCVFGPLSDRERLARCMASADALLHGGAAEICATVVAEAMASGLPLIVPDFGGALGWAQPAFAEVYRAGDAQACADAIQRLLQRDQEAMRNAARHAAEQTLTEPGQHFQQLFAHYEGLRVAAGQRRAPADAAASPRLTHAPATP